MRWIGTSGSMPGTEGELGALRPRSGAKMPVADMASLVHLTGSNGLGAVCEPLPVRPPLSGTRPRARCESGDPDTKSRTPRVVRSEVTPNRLFGAEHLAWDLRLLVVSVVNGIVTSRSLGLVSGARRRGLFMSRDPETV